jgi:peptidoglycan/LPS O-acetylase OafA/YrhL
MTTPAKPLIRLHELDSIRGLAALTVVIHHFSLMWPAWLASLKDVPFGPFAINLLHPFVAGREAVMLFFVLSGLVLALPYLRGRAQAYPTFLVRRILRIYCPYLGALAICIAGAAIWHGDLHHGDFAAPFWSEPVQPMLVLQHILFLGVYQWQQFDFVIWSLIDEMRISLIFPFVALLIIRVRARTAILLGVAGSMLAFIFTRNRPPLGVTSNLMMTVHFVAFFILGILVAKHLASLSARYLSLSRLARTAVLVLSFVLYYCSIAAFGVFGHNWAGFMADWAVVLGAIGFIFVGLNSPTAKRFLNSTVPAFLGRISYSLYLVHAPVLLALTFASRNHVSIWAQFLIYMVTTFALAYIFCLLVEEPFTRMGQRIGKRMQAARPEALPSEPRIAAAVR